MASLATKLCAAGLSATLAAGAIYLAWREASPRPFPRPSPRPSVELRIGTESGTPEEPAIGAPTPRSAAVDGASALELEHPRDPPSAFVRTPWREQRFAQGRDLTLPDPHVQYRYRPNVELRHAWPEHPAGEWVQRTNSLGLREDDELLPEPDLRILVAGDSHTDGVCDNDESFTNRLEALLRAARPDEAIEALNAGRGGYGLYQYLGTLERFLELRPDVFVVAVYGGNDFSEVLTPFHRFNGTEQPPGSELYADELAEALRDDELAPALAQAFSSYKYFDLHPDELETALQAARDVTTEIVVTCLRQGIHPVFVYLPPMADVEWDTAPEVFERLSEVLGVSPEGLRSTERLAEAWIAYLRRLRVDVLDAREVFRRAGPGNYWIADQHIDVAAHARLAEALLPLVDAAHPAGTRRARRAPVATGPLDPVALLSPGSAFEGELAPSAPSSEGDASAGLVAVEPLDEPTALARFGRPEHTVFDPLAGYRWAPNLALASRALGFERDFVLVTNGDGLRMDAPLATRVDLRVVLSGDEQASGPGSNAETLAGRLARRLLGPDGRSVEVVDAAVPGHGPHNWVGVLERSRALAPDAFVVTLASGTDFLDALRVDSQRAGRPLGRNLEDDAALLSDLRANHPPAVTRALERSLASVRFFQSHRSRGNRAFELLRDAVLELERLCQADGIELLVLHVPDPLALEWPLHREALGPVLLELGLEPSQLDTHARLSETLLAELAARGIRVVRLEDEPAGAMGPAFLPGELLLAPAANERAAELLAAELGGAQR